MQIETHIATPPTPNGLNAGRSAIGYRSRAGGARDVAARTLDGVTRRLLLEIAEYYEQVAETLDRIAAHERVVRNRTAPTRAVI